LPALQRVRLSLLLPGKRTLLARIADLFTALCPLRCRQTAQFAILVPAQGALGPQLLARIELGLCLRLYGRSRLCLRLQILPLRLQVLPSLHSRLRLLALQRALLPHLFAPALILILPDLLLSHLALLHRAIDDCR